MSVSGLKFVITGGGDGMGAATAKLAAQNGAKVVIADINRQKGEETVASITKSGGEAWFQECDITNDDALETLMRISAEHMGGIDVLHNNAGVIDGMIGEDADIALPTYSRAVWERVLAINLTAPLFATKHAFPFLKESANASVIIAASVASYIASPKAIAYTSSKGGVGMLTKQLSIELAPHKIRVNAYSPGVIRTPMTEGYLENAEDKAAVERALVNTQTVPRMGEPEEIAELVCYLAGDKSKFVNGVLWPIDGGMLAWRHTIDLLGM